jgi:hypothetical protein
VARSALNLIIAKVKCKGRASGYTGRKAPLLREMAGDRQTQAFQQCSFFSIRLNNELFSCVISEF